MHAELEDLGCALQLVSALLECRVHLCELQVKKDFDAKLEAHMLRNSFFPGDDD